MNMEEKVLKANDIPMGYALCSDELVQFLLMGSPYEPVHEELGDILHLVAYL